MNIKPAPYKLMSKGKPRLSSVMDLTEKGDYKVIFIDMSTKYTDLYQGSCEKNGTTYPEVSIIVNENSLHMAKSKHDSINISFEKYKGYRIIGTQEYRYGHQLILFKPRKKK